MSDSVRPHRRQPSGCPIPRILQARTLEWVAISFSNAWKWKVKSESEITQSCPTLQDRMDCSPPGSSVHGIFQARVLEWGAIAFSQRLYTQPLFNFASCLVYLQVHHPLQFLPWNAILHYLSSRSLSSIVKGHFQKCERIAILLLLIHINGSIYRLE